MEDIDGREDKDCPEADGGNLARNMFCAGICIPSWNKAANKGCYFDISWIVAKFMRDNPQGFVNISENLQNAKGRGWVQPKAYFRIQLHGECGFTGADKPVMGLFACHE